MIYLLGDILIYNLSPYHSYLILLNLGQKNWLYLVLVGLILDFFLATYGFHLFFFLGIYLMQRYVFRLNLNNFLYYGLFQLSIFFTYFIFSHLLFGYFTYPVLIEAFLLQCIFILFSYKMGHVRINLIG